MSQSSADEHRLRSDARMDNGKATCARAMRERAFCTDILSYQVGALLYTPALNRSVAHNILSGHFCAVRSVCLCLEDAVQEKALPEAERTLAATLEQLMSAGASRETMPLLFARVRTPEHLEHVRRYLGERESMLTGYVLPKFDNTNAERYAEQISRWNDAEGARLTVMPILESADIADAPRRAASLESLRGVLDDVKPRVLNLRVGGNDLCNLYGVRRSVRQTIYDIGAVRDVLSDIINVFGGSYVVAGPVWEYFGTDSRGAWADGLRRELELDLANGFIGKTAIHPSQVPVIHEGLKVTQEDLDDARSILHWKPNAAGVEKSASGHRMNEEVCHGRWAKRILARARVYGALDGGARILRGGRDAQ